jgi:beta-galactosidase
MNLLRIVFSVLVLIAALPAQEGAQTQSSFYPVSVWYSGGKARAPMLEELSGDSARLWKEDLLRIKGLGFNTVRTWVEWNVGEPREGNITWKIWTYCYGWRMQWA